MKIAVEVVFADPGLDNLNKVTVQEIINLKFSKDKTDGAKPGIREKTGKAYSPSILLMTNKRPKVRNNLNAHKNWLLNLGSVMALNKPTKQESDKVNSRKLFFSNLSLFFALVLFI